MSAQKVSVYFLAYLSMSRREKSALILLDKIITAKCMVLRHAAIHACICICRFMLTSGVADAMTVFCLHLSHGLKEMCVMLL